MFAVFTTDIVEYSNFLQRSRAKFLCTGWRGCVCEMFYRWWRD